MKALGIILAGGNNSRMQELSSKRAIAAMPVGGSFRCIDFPLSNMSNSHVQKVAVLTQYNARSLNEHLSSSKWWDFGRKQGGLYVFNPTVTVDNSWWYRGTADAMYQNMDFLKRSHEPYVIIAAGDCVYKLDYNKVLEYHIAKKADITVVCKDMPKDEDVSRYGVVRMNEDSRIVEFEEKPMMAQSNTISAGIYVVRRRQLIEMLERCAQENRHDFVTDILIRYKNMKRIFGYKLDSYWNNIATVESYFKTNMDFLKPEVRKYFRDAPHIYSKVDDLPPAKYNAGSEVRNSLVSSG
ncbi:MAG: glucose-1-phosphate adenylyltransferase subunit GlgD, partial [Lachnospiraceae bacterium]